MPTTVNTTPRDTTRATREKIFERMLAEFPGPKGGFDFKAAFVAHPEWAQELKWTEGEKYQDRVYAAASAWRRNNGGKRLVIRGALKAPAATRVERVEWSDAHRAIVAQATRDYRMPNGNTDWTRAFTEHPDWKANLPPVSSKAFLAFANRVRAKMKKGWKAGVAPVLVSIPDPVPSVAVATPPAPAAPQRMTSANTYTDEQKKLAKQIIQDAAFQRGKLTSWAAAFEAHPEWKALLKPGDTSDYIFNSFVLKVRKELKAERKAERASAGNGNGHEPGQLFDDGGLEVHPYICAQCGHKGTYMQVPDDVDPRLLMQAYRTARAMAKHVE